MIHVTLQRNGAYWQARWRDLADKPHGKSMGPRATVPKREALDRTIQLQAELNAGLDRTGKVPTLSTWAETYLAGRRNMAEGTRYLYRQTIARLTEHFGDRPVDRITALEATRWRAGLYDGDLAEATVCRIVREAKSILGEAVRARLLAVSPMAELRSTAPPLEKNWAYIDTDTLTRLLRACPDGRWRRLLALCRLAGLRRGEATALRWSNVDLIARRLTVENPGRYQTTKRRTRTVPVAPALHDELFAGYMEAGGAEYVVGELRSPWRTFRAVCTRADVAPWTRWCHTLRKNCEQDWLEAGVGIHALTDMLGNSPAVALKHYLRAGEADYDRVSLSSSSTAEPVPFGPPNRRIRTIP